MIARFGAISFSRYRIVQGTHLNSPPLHHQPSLLAMVGALRRILVERLAESPSPLVEATGWQRLDNGTVELTARERVGDRWMRSNCPVIP
ncbi:Molybdopterin biosynthesis protein MoeB [Geitlerinema sp. FC II]|nr:Molybdopterin biosynthesis protein MoeB [Geitlerinema sp. FC II]